MLCSWFEEQDASELQVLNYRMFANDLGIEHFEQALRNLLPRRHSADVVEHGRRLCESCPFLDLLDEADAAEVHVVVLLPQGALVVDALRDELL